MESISLKMENKMLQDMDRAIEENNFGTRTEFIRSAIRDKIENYSKEQLIKEFLTFKGKSKTKTTYEQNKKTREEVSELLLKELERKFK